ncbi:MAG: pentapeptide repeat-containing protein [bacterium]
MINTTIKDADLGNADFTYAYFYSKKRDYNGTDKDAIMENVTAQQANFSNSFMSNMTFANVAMKDCSFSGAQLVGTEFISGNMRGSVFSGAYLQGADLSDVEKTDASFAGAYVSPDEGYWHYTSDDPECSEIRINYKKTDLGDSSSVVCPNGEKGPCDTEEKLTPKNTSGKEPPCVDGDEDIFGNNDCINHEYLKRGEIPECNEENKDVMQCGCLVSSD